MEASERITHRYSPGDKVFCDVPNDLIARGVYTVKHETKSRECLILEGKGGYRFDKIRFEPCNVPLLAPAPSSATEVRAKMLEHQRRFNEALLHQQKYASEWAKLGEIVREFDAYVNKHSLTPSEVGFGPPLPQPDVAKPAKRRGKLHHSPAIHSAIATYTLRSDGRPPRFIPLTCKPTSSP